jgi:hypothetical protein
MSFIAMPNLGRPAIGLARHAHDAAHALRDDVEAAFLPVGAGLAEAGNRRIDDARVDFLDRLVVDAELFGDARPEILDDDVGRGGELHEYFLALRLLHVERDALLVAIEHRKAIALVVDLGLEAARAVAFGKSFDLGHVGAHVREHQRAVRSGHDGGEIEHLHAFKWKRHPGSPARVRIACYRDADFIRFGD